MSWFDTLLWPLMVAVAWLMVQFHKLLTLLGLGSASGVTWALSIVGLVIIIRILLIPLFMRQIKAARGMQMLSPELQALQKKYKGRNDPASREAMTRETMDLYKKHGTNPFSSCLPILAQSPIFFALFRVLNELGRLARGEYPKPNIGPLTQELAIEANSATIFDAPISSSFLMEGATTQTKIVAVVLIALDVHHDLHDAEAADAEEHAGVGAPGPDGAAAEDAALHPSAGLRDLRRELPPRCPHLLVDDQPLVDGSAVLRDQAQPDTRVRGRPTAQGAAGTQGGQARHRARGGEACRAREAGEGAAAAAGPEGPRAHAASGRNAPSCRREAR